MFKQKQLIHKYENKVDMHFHSTGSDGAKTNEEILQDAIHRELLVAMCTDHNYVNFELAELFNSNGIVSCPGVEISVKNEFYPVGAEYMHFTAYSKNFSKGLLDILAVTRKGRIEKVKAQIKKMQENGFKIDYDDFVDFSQKQGYNIENLNIFHISEYIFQNDDNKELILSISGEYDQIRFIKTFLKGTGDYSEYACEEIEEYCPSIEDVCECFDFESGIFSLAHPRNYFELAKELKVFLFNCISFGLNGIELNPGIKFFQFESILKFISKYDLFITSGTDTHFASENDTRPKFGTTNSYFGYIDREMEKIIIKLGI